MFKEDPFLGKFRPVPYLSITLKDVPGKDSHAEVRNAQALLWHPTPDIQAKPGEIYEACVDSNLDEDIVLHVLIVAATDTHYVYHPE